MKNIRQVGEYAVPGDDSVIHNVMVIGRYAYMSYYKRGMRIVDISSPANIREVASFETWDGRSIIDNTCFEGAWGVYAEENGRVYISDISTGIWVFDFAQARESLPEAQFTFPRGGEQFFQGQQIQIEWEISEPDDDSFNSITADHAILAQQLELSIDGGVTYEPIATQLNGDARSFSFKLPAVLTEQGKLRLVLNAGSSPLFFHSDGLFKIIPNIPNDKPPSVRLISPQGGEQFIVGQQIRVDWVSSDDKGLISQRIGFSDDFGRTYTELARLDGNAQSALINLPQIVSLNCRIRITVDDGTNPPASSATASNFAIFAKLPVIRALALKASSLDRLMIDLDPAGDLLPQSSHIRPSHEENENNVTVEINSGSGLVAYREQGKVLRGGTRLITKGLLANGQKTREAIPEGKTVTIRLTNNNGARAEVKVIRQGLTFNIQK
jgi:hypothetical protein